MDASSTIWPRFVFHWNGNMRVVANQEERDALPPGYSDDGIPDTRAMGLDWNQGCGPLSREPTYERYQFAILGMTYNTAQHRPPGGPMCVVALRGLTYNYRARVPGEKFLLEDRWEDRALWESGAIAASPSVAKPRYIDPDTGRWFQDEIPQAHYAQCRENDDIAALGFEIPHPPHDTASTLEPEAAAHTRRGAPEYAEWRQWTLQNLVDILKPGLQKAKLENPEKKYLGLTRVAPATGYSRRDLGRAMSNLGYDWEKILPLLNE